MSGPDTRSFFSKRTWLWWLMVATFVLVIAMRLHRLSFPLERDEGEYAYAGQLIEQGIPPYELAYNMKFPGTYLGYAVIMAIFGQTPAGIHLGLMILTTATGLMLFWLGKKILDETAGVVAATAYVLLAASPAMLGLAGHATHFCAFFATAGMCLMWRARRDDHLAFHAASAVCFGTAILMKQHAAIIAAWAGLAFAYNQFFVRKTAIPRRIGIVALCAVSMLAPFGLCCLWLWHAGVFDKFWFWTIGYARAYASVVPLNYAPILFWHSFTWVITKGILIWIIAAAGFCVIWFDARWKNSRGWVLGFCMASALAVCPDLYFRKHYFLIALPAVGLLAGATISGLRAWWGERSKTSILRDWPAFIYALAIITTVFSCQNIWFKDSLIEAMRGEDNNKHEFIRTDSFLGNILVNIGLLSNNEHGLYGADPLPESEVVAKYIQDNSTPDTRIGILGSEPEIYFLAHRHSATGYIYVYPLMEPQPFAQKMQSEMIGDLVTNKPQFIIFADNIMSWNQRDDSNRGIFHWWDDYKTNYTLVGMADVLSRTNTIYVFGTNFVAHYPTAHGCALEIYQRKSP